MKNLLNNLPELPCGEFTLVNKTKGSRICIQIRTQKKDSKFKPRAQIVSLVRISDGEKFPLAHIENGALKIWKKASEQDQKIVSFGVNSLALDQVGSPDERLEMLQVRKCRICNRTLRVPDSIKACIGPECAKKY